jgi:hypothetical protein
VDFGPLFFEAQRFSRFSNNSGSECHWMRWRDALRC